MRCGKKELTFLVLKELTINDFKLCVKLKTIQ